MINRDHYIMIYFFFECDHVQLMVNPCLTFTEFATVLFSVSVVGPQKPTQKTFSAGMTGRLGL